MAVVVALVVGVLRWHDAKVPSPCAINAALKAEDTDSQLPVT